MKEIGQVIEHQLWLVLKRLVRLVSDAGCDGNRDASQTIKSDTMKLLGNFTYGKTLTNKQKHLDVVYVDVAGTIKLINTPQIKKNWSKWGKIFMRLNPWEWK